MRTNRTAAHRNRTAGALPVPPVTRAFSPGTGAELALKPPEPQPKASVWAAEDAAAVPAYAPIARLSLDFEEDDSRHH